MRYTNNIIIYICTNWSEVHILIDMGIDNTYINSDNRVDEGLRIRSTDSIIYFNNKKAKFFQQFRFVS